VNNDETPKLVVRQARLSDVPGISKLTERVYPGMPPYPRDMLHGQINAFPEGVWVAELGDEIVGYCATIKLPEEQVLAPHTWRQITGGGFGSTHDERGDYLYGYEVCVDPEMRRYRIGQRFYRERRRLAEFQRLKGIALAGRIPNYAKRARQYPDVNDYIEAVRNRKVRDPVLNFQLRNGFEPIGVLRGYLPHDDESGGFAVHLVWHNPQYAEPVQAPAVQRHRSAMDRVRLASVQYKQRRIRSFDEFTQMVLYFIDVTADYGSDFVLFPELFTLQLLSIENDPVRPDQAIRQVAEFEERINNFFMDAAVRYNVNIVGGSTPGVRGDAIRNIAHVYLRDGTVVSQEKIHPTPNERYWWNITGGNELVMIDTDCGPVGVLICYDSEFPELTRHLVNQGINVLFVPFLTDERQSYLRVRYCAQARAVENQIYVAMSGSCGNLPNVHNIDIHYAQSCILTPCDFPFARDGIAADTTPNVEMVAFADLSFRALRDARQHGTVRNLKDRRHDLYSVAWHGKARRG
jgi:predicted amidohydrolase/GNAT superfamily N-acetyltransferase